MSARVEVIAWPVTAVELGEGLRLSRLDVSLSQNELADLLGLPKYQIKNWEHGQGLRETVNVFAAFHACGRLLKIGPAQTLLERLKR